MRTFVQEQKQLPRAASSSPARSLTVMSELHHRADRTLDLQETSGGRTGQQMEPTNAEEREAGLTDTAARGLGHDFGRISIQPPAVVAIQTQLATNRPGDEHEQEATQAAEQVMPTPEPQQSRRPTFFVAGGKLEEETTKPEEVENRGLAPSDGRPALFQSNGMTGGGVYYLAGGPGGRGNQNAGTTQNLIVPTITPHPRGGPTACVARGTGVVEVVRSYTGVSPGDQGVDGAGRRWFITNPAAQRIDLHEQRHIDAARAIHDATILPMEGRIRSSICPQYRSNLAGYIDWNVTLRLFSVQDSAMNGPGQTLDTAELSAPDAPQVCPSNVQLAGITYQKYMHMPTENCP